MMANSRIGKIVNVKDVSFLISYDSELCEYQVRVYERGKQNYKRSYLTDSLSDAQETMVAMIKEEENNSGNKTV